MIGENLLGPEPTLLPADDEVTAALAAGAEPAAVVRAHPESSLAWALLADEADAEGREIDDFVRSATIVTDADATASPKPSAGLFER